MSFVVSLSGVALALLAATSVETPRPGRRGATRTFRASGRANPNSACPSSVPRAS